MADPKDDGTELVDEPVDRKEGDTKRPKVFRNLPGTPGKLCFAAWPPEQKFEELDGQFAIQEYIQQLIRKDPSDIATICKCPKGHDSNVWILEHLRIFLAQLNLLAVYLSEDCTGESCPMMVATKDWEFLCAAHQGAPRKCSAIDYTVHTLSGFNALLNSDEFPSRVRVTPKAIKFFPSIARRLYRLFAHPYYHHRQIFDEFERDTHLCKRFLQFTTAHQLMSKKEFTPPMNL